MFFYSTKKKKKRPTDTGKAAEITLMLDVTVVGWVLPNAAYEGDAAALKKLQDDAQLCMKTANVMLDFFI